MNTLENKTTYLIGAIHSTREGDHGIKWREQITPILENRYQIKVLDPCKISLRGFGEMNSDKDVSYFKKLIRERQYALVKEQFYWIIKKDLRCVDKSDFVIFHHDPTISTIGSMHEVINAINQKKPVLIHCEENLMDHFNPWLLTLIKPQWLFTSWDDMWKYLDIIAEGKIDSSWWW
jgi:hypothetical protein